MHFTYYPAAVLDTQISLNSFELHLVKSPLKQTLATRQSVTITEWPHEYQFPVLHGNVFTFH